MAESSSPERPAARGYTQADREKDTISPAKQAASAASAAGWPRCEKCGGDDVLCRWHGEGAYDPSRRHAPCWGDYGDTRGKPAEEHLHYHCRRFQFDWT